MVLSPADEDGEAAQRGIPRTRPAVVTLGVLFTATGFVGVLVEQVYEKLLGTLVGASTPAAAMVLAAYFGGLTAGALFYEGAFRRRVRNAIRVYAILEGGVAIIVAFTALMFGRVELVFVPMLAAVRHNVVMLQLARLFVAAVWIVPPTFLMGASLPAIGDAIRSLGVSALQRKLTIFYALNLAGSIISAAIAPYLIFPWFGLDGALALGAAIGGAVCLAAWRTAGRTEAEQTREEEASASGATRSVRMAILAIAFLSGFAYFSLEVVWVHLLAAVIGNSVYAFATMLLVVLIGLGIGSALIALLVAREGSTSWLTISSIAIAGGIALMSTHGLWPQIPHSLALAGGAIREFGPGEFLRFRHALSVVILPGTVLGMLFPAVLRLRRFPIDRFGAFIGRTYAANAIGCVTGALTTVFLLLPRVGSERLLTAYSLALIVSGSILASLSTRRAWPLAAAATAIGVLVAGLPVWDRMQLTSGEHVYFAPLHVTPHSHLRLCIESPADGFTTVVESRGPDGSPVRTLLTNGKFQGNDGGEHAAQIAFALIPSMMLNHFDDALVIGAGTGATASVVHDLGFRRVRVAEIAPGILVAARTQFTNVNHRVFDQPNVRVDIEDGRNVLLLDDARYDLVTMEITSVWFANSTNLYSREFYETARRRLKPGGVLQQWIQLHHIGLYEVGSVIASMRSVFPYVSLWSAGGQGIVVGSNEPQVFRAAAFAQVRGLRDRMQWDDRSFVAEIGQIARSQVLSPRAVDHFVRTREFILNTDANRYLEYWTPRYNLDPARTVERLTGELLRWSDRSMPAIEPQAAAMLR